MSRVCAQALAGGACKHEQGWRVSMLSVSMSRGAVPVRKKMIDAGTL